MKHACVSSNLRPLKCNIHKHSAGLKFPNAVAKQLLQLHYYRPSILESATLALEGLLKTYQYTLIKHSAKCV